MQVVARGARWEILPGLSFPPPLLSLLVMVMIPSLFLVEGVIGKDLRLRGGGEDGTSTDPSRKGQLAPDATIYGLTAPLGPLANSFVANLRLPGFPFEFPSIIPGSSSRYLIFPSPDSIADHAASQRRCAVYGGELVHLNSPVEMEVLACAIGSPSFVGKWLDQGKDEEQDGKGEASCLVLYPGGILSISPTNCHALFGSICEIPSTSPGRAFQL